jgi:hypothetical protein
VQSAGRNLWGGSPFASATYDAVLSPTAKEYHVDMSRIFLRFHGANHWGRPASDDFFLREEPDEDEDEEEGNGTDDEGDDRKQDDDEEDDGGYSVCLYDSCPW